MQLGLIGYPLSHSWSPGWYQKKFADLNMDGSYQLFSLPSLENFKDFLSRYNNLEGFNVTIPYKTTIIPFLDELDPEAEAVGAVNTVTITRSTGKVFLKGFNTDITGFEETLPAMPTGTKALVLGTGGASKAVSHVLSKRGIPFLNVSRAEKQGETIGYSALNEEIIKTHLLIINTTPAGMSPNVEQCPTLPYNMLTYRHFLYDLIYNPPVTKFLGNGAEKGAGTMNGLQMLIVQAETAFVIFQSRNRLTQYCSH